MAFMWLYISSSSETKLFDFEVKLDLEGQAQLPLKTIEIVTKLCYLSGLNLVIPPWMGDVLWCGQNQNRVNSDFKVKFDLEGQARFTPPLNKI